MSSPFDGIEKTRSGGPTATDKQIDFIHDLCDRLGIEPPANVEDYAVYEASELIDEMREELDAMDPGDRRRDWSGP